MKSSIYVPIGSVLWFIHLNGGADVSGKVVAQRVEEKCCAKLIPASCLPKQGMQTSCKFVKPGLPCILLLDQAFRHSN